VKPELRRFGISQSAVVVIDGFSGNSEAVAQIADAMAPFPPPDPASYYPGVRRVIEESDEAAFAYARRACEATAPYIAGAFDMDGFNLVEASFSIVSVAPGELRPAQRAPHFDSPDQNYFALLHYLRVPRGSGTAFYRQRSTGIERVTEANLDTFVRIAKAEAATLPPGSGYIRGSDAFFEQIGSVEAVPDRLVIYRGSLLHSGVIPDEMCFSADPGEGRLTANLFVRAY
jgi:hypothetical protein